MLARAYDPHVSWRKPFPQESSYRLSLSRLLVIGSLALSVAFIGLGLMAESHTPPSDNPYLWDQLKVGMVLVSVGAFVAWCRPSHRLGWLALVAGVSYLTTFAGQPGVLWLMINRPGWEPWIRGILAFAVSGWLVGRGILLALVPLCYPDRAPVGRTLRAVWIAGSTGIAVAALAHSRLHTPAYFNGIEPTGLALVAQRAEPWAWRIVLVCSAVAIITMVVRVARLPIEVRGRHLPVAVISTLLVIPVVSSMYGELRGEDLFGWSESVLVGTTIAFPVVLLYGVMRHGLLDIRVVVRRSTVYFLTALALAAIYAVVAWSITTTIARDQEVSRIIGTGVVALLAMPIYTKVHRIVDERIFGHRDDPSAVLAAIGSTVEQAPQGTAALALVTATLCRELRVPYTAVDLYIAHENASEANAPLRLRVAEGGVPTDDVDSFALNGSDGPIGELLVARRTPRESFRLVDRVALQGIASHVAALAVNVALTEQLLASRRQLVTAREEERRRIRRDLHDGLGPTLASVCLGLGAAGERIGHESDLGGLLQELEDELRAAVDEIRQLVYALRPPALDELGLAGAVRDHIAALAARSANDGNAIQLAIDSDGMADSLPAAVEVAAFRITLEAITNVTRHAFARHCWVRLNTSVDMLHVEVEDDGQGVDPTHPAGVGLRSMRERATELGGDLMVRPRTPHGTLVLASLPLSPTLL